MAGSWKLIASVGEDLWLVAPSGWDPDDVNAEGMMIEDGEARKVNLAAVLRQPWWEPPPEGVSIEEILKGVKILPGEAEKISDHSLA
jgi:hypothetical protein